MSILGALIVFILCLCIVLLPTHFAVIPFFLSILYLPVSEQLDLAGFHLFGYRLVLLFGMFRIVVKGEVNNIQLQKYEYLLFVNFFWIAIATGLRESSVSSMLNGLSVGFDAGMAYLFARATLTNISNLNTIGNIFSIAMLPLMFLLLFEKLSAHNLFSIFNGVRDVPLIRDGKVRAQGPFLHPILAGTLAAVHFPLAINSFKQNKKIGIIGCVSILGVIYASASSGPIMSLLFTIIAMMLWYKKDNIGNYRRGLYVSLLILEIVKRFRGGHVWDLLSSIDLTGSSDGWHRAALITSAIQHFSEWWIVGTSYTRHWMPTGVTFSPNHTDITNHYILQCINGGLFSLIIFTFFIYKAFKHLGICIKETDSPHIKFSLWLLGSILFSHTATFISVSYFDQTVLLFYFLIGTITSIHSNRMFNENRESMPTI